MLVRGEVIRKLLTWVRVTQIDYMGRDYVNSLGIGQDYGILLAVIKTFILWHTANVLKMSKCVKNREPYGKVYCDYFK